MSEYRRIINAERSVIPAADVSAANFVGLVQAVGNVEGVGAIKIGFQVALGRGLAYAVDTMRRLGRKELKAIYDHQKAGNDIPDTGANFAQAMVEGGVDAAILFPFTGPETQKAWIQALQDKEIGVMVGSEMTHPKIRRSEGGYIADDAFTEMFELAIDEGVHDFVVPGNKPDRVAEYHDFFEKRVDGGFSLYAPGFVAQGGSISEAGKAAGKSWHAIVGRAITQADDRRAAAIEQTSQILSEEV